MAELGNRLLSDPNRATDLIKSEPAWLLVSLLDYSASELDVVLGFGGGFMVDLCTTELMKRSDLVWEEAHGGGDRKSA